MSADRMHGFASLSSWRRASFNTMPDIQNLESFTYPLSLLSTPVWLFDVDRLRVVWANAAGLALWNASSLDELQQRDMAEGISRKVRERLNQFRDDLGGMTCSATEHWTFYPKGEPCTYECSISVLDVPDQERWLMVHATCEDQISDADTLYRSSALLHTSLCVSVFDRQGTLKYSNPAARRMFGSPTSKLGERFVDIGDWHSAREKLAQHGELTFEAQMVTASGPAWHCLTLELNPDPVSGKSSILMSEADISDRRAAQELVHQLAYSDTLTGLPNRTSWMNTLNSRLDDSASRKRSLAILFVDLDRFKVINDTLGHALGDQLLVAVAKRLQSCLDSDQYLARLGGDEFTLLLDETVECTRSTDMAQRIVTALATPMNIEGHELSMTPSIGISVYPRDGLNANVLMQQADLAMYAAKESGGGFNVFESHMTVQIQRRLRIENDLRQAIDNGDLQVYYQPKISAANGHVLGMEALARWNHPTLGWVPPTDFIAVAEETGMIGEITQHVLLEALRQQTRWSSQALPVSVAINVSPLEFRRGDFTDVVRRALMATGCEPGCVELEITESMLMADSDSIQSILGSLTGLGVKLSIDDFGSGYSNLGYLQKFPISSLKIDRSFLSDEGISPVIDLIIGMGQTLSLSVVAEGVETPEQRDFLIAHGCDQLQGYLFAKPMDACAATRYLLDHDAQQACQPRRAVAVA